MLNVGVALWWLLRPGPVQPPPWMQPEGVPKLQLLGEPVDPGAGAEARLVDPALQRDAGQGPDVSSGPLAADRNDADSASPRDAAVALDADAAPASAPADAPALRCFSVGPYASVNVATAARQALQSLGPAQVHMREEAGSPRAWQVTIAPQADRAAADALAARIRDAGFDDLLVLAQGEDANGIALGRYSSAAAARRRESALSDAGFPARLQPVGDIDTQHWLDVAAGPGLESATARRTANASQVRDIDCASIVATGPAR